MLLRGAWTQVNYTQLLKFFDRVEAVSDRKVAVFDFDNTSILNDIGEASFYYFVDEALFNFPKILSTPALWEAFLLDGRNSVQSAVQMFWGQKKKEPKKPPRELAAWAPYRKTLYRAHKDLCLRKGNEACDQWVVQIMAGKTPGQVREAARLALMQELARAVGREPIASGPGDTKPFMIQVGIRPYVEIKNLMQVLRRKGFEVWIVSSSSQHLVEPAAGRLFNIPSSRVVGVRSKIEAGHLTAEVELLTYRQGKVEAIKDAIGVAPLLVAGDSDGDWEMLDYSQDLRIVIDRKKEISRHALEEKAEGQAWLIQPGFIQ